MIAITLSFSLAKSTELHTTYNGEARAFMKYQDDSVDWFHFEIFSNTGAQSLVDHYDDSYDQIIEDYYKELESLYQ